MNIAVNIDFQSTSDLDLENDRDFETRLRSCCGLFISIYHGKVYFLHQTAREFLIDAALPTANLPKLPWHRSITMRNAHAILAEICVLYLNLLSFHTRLSKDATAVGYHTSFSFELVDYSARFWNAHFHEANFKDGDIIMPFTLRICDPISESYSQWFEIYMQSIHYGEIKGARSESFTPLMVAAYCGNCALVELLIQQGADIGAKDNLDRTPLFWASYNEHEAAVKMLLEKGADIEVKDSEYGWTPLFWASFYGHEAVIKILLENGADIEVKDSASGRTPLHWASINGNDAAIIILLKNGADIEVKDGESGRTPLYWALLNENEAAMKILLENGADIEVEDNEHGLAPLHWASIDENEAFVKILLENGADIGVKDSKHGATPLHWASQRGYEALVKLLLENGADLTVKDNYNRTPLSLAKEYGHEAIVKLLQGISQNYHATHTFDFFRA